MHFTPKNPKQTLFEAKVLSNINLSSSFNTSLGEALPKAQSDYAAMEIPHLQFTNGISCGISAQVLGQQRELF